MKRLKTLTILLSITLVGCTATKAPTISKAKERLSIEQVDTGELRCEKVFIAGASAHAIPQERKICLTDKQRKQIGFRCKRQSVTGSNIKQKVCSTAAQREAFVFDE